MYFTFFPLKLKTQIVPIRSHNLPNFTYIYSSFYGINTLPYGSLWTSQYSACFTSGKLFSISTPTFWKEERLGLFNTGRKTTDIWKLHETHVFRHTHLATRILGLTWGLSPGKIQGKDKHLFSSFIIAMYSWLSDSSTNKEAGNFRTPPHYVGINPKIIEDKSQSLLLSL